MAIFGMLCCCKKKKAFFKFMIPAGTGSDNVKCMFFERRVHSNQHYFLRNENLMKIVEDMWKNVNVYPCYAFQVFHL